MDRPIVPKRRPFRRALILVVLVYAVSVLAACARVWVDGSDGAGRRAAGLAPVPQSHPEAIVQVYAARTWGVKKALAVHTWIAVKRAGDDRYTTWQIIGWRLRRGSTALVTGHRAPDLPWYGNPAKLLLDIRGPQAEGLIEEIADAVARYPHADKYRAWPGPNSNTFTAFVAREVPGLELDLPSTAIGKDYLINGNPLLGRSSAGDGFQLSLFGLAGLALSPQVGLEVNVLGLNLELDLLDLAIELPGFGRLGAGP